MSFSHKTTKMTRVMRTFTVCCMLMGAYAAVDRMYHPEQDCKRFDSYCYNGPKLDADHQFKTCSLPGTVALTFDNAPSMYTGNILDVLKSNGVKATFFLKGANILAYPSLAQRIIDEGHQVGSNSFDLDILTDITSNKFEEDLLAYEAAFNTLTFKKNLKKYYRGPRGFMTEDVNFVLNLYGYTPVQWTLRSGDVYASNVNDVLMTLSTYIDGSSVDGQRVSAILQMDADNQVTGSNLGTILNYLTTTLGKKGVRFVGINECAIGNGNGKNQRFKNM